MNDINALEPIESDIYNPNPAHDLHVGGLHGWHLDVSQDRKWTLTVSNTGLVASPFRLVAATRQASTLLFGGDWVIRKFFSSVEPGDTETYPNLDVDNEDQFFFVEHMTADTIWHAWDVKRDRSNANLDPNRDICYMSWGGTEANPAILVTLS